MVFAEPCGGTAREGGCRLSLGFPLKVVEEGGAIKVRSLEPPCFLFYFYDWAFFY